MSVYLGDFAQDAIVPIPINTMAASGASVAPSSAFEAADLKIFKIASDGTVTQKSTSNGITMTSPLSSITGVHLALANMSVDTGDVGFWTGMADYLAVLNPDETIDSQAVNYGGWLWSCENRSALRPTTAGRTLDVDASGRVLLGTVIKNTQLTAFPFFMVDSADHVSGKTGLTVTAERSIDGAAFAACANAVAEISAGWYKITLSAGDLNGDTIALKFTAAGADPTEITVIPER